MASWQVIEFTGQTLVRILRAHLDVLLPTNNIDVQVASAALFDQFAQTTRPSITLFLYRIMESEQRSDLPSNPLPLDLCYMVTPWSVRTQQTPENDATATQEEHRLLGAVMQAFYDHREISRAELVDGGALNPVWTPFDAFQLQLERSPPTEDLFRIWDSTELVYRTSLTYRARVALLDSLRPESAPRVVDATFTDGAM